MGGFRMKNADLRTDAYSGRSPADIDAISAALVGLDRDAHALERRWGVGRLVVLADDLLRERFTRQRRKLDDAIQSTAPAASVLPQVEATRRGWHALEAAALAAGHAPAPPVVWEARLADGSVLAVCRDAADASLAAADGRARVVVTLAEIARLYDARPEVIAVKRLFPGATVSAIRSRPAVDWDSGDPLPW